MGNRGLLFAGLFFLKCVHVCVSFYSVVVVVLFSDLTGSTLDDLGLAILARPASHVWLVFSLNIFTARVTGIHKSINK